MINTKSIITFVGYIAIAIFCTCLFVFSQKKNIEDADERQLLFQGKALSAGFSTMLISNFLFFCAIRTFNFTFHIEVFYMVSILLGFTTSLVVSFWTDSIFTRKNKKIMIILCIVWLVIIVRQIYYVIISYKLENIIILISVIIPPFAIVITLLLKSIINKKEKNNE